MIETQATQYAIDYSASPNYRKYRSRGNCAMDKLIEYPQLIKRILTEYVELCRHPQQDIETFLIADEQNGHYI